MLCTVNVVGKFAAPSVPMHSAYAQLSGATALKPEIVSGGFFDDGTREQAELRVRRYVAGKLELRARPGRLTSGLLTMLIRLADERSLPVR